MHMPTHDGPCTDTYLLDLEVVLQISSTLSSYSIDVSIYWCYLHVLYIHISKEYNIGKECSTVFWPVRLVLLAFFDASRIVTPEHPGSGTGCSAQKKTIALERDRV